MSISSRCLVPLVLLPLAVAAQGEDRSTDRALRDDVEDLVLRAWDPRFQRLSGPSPTARVRELISAGDARVRPLLAEAWRNCHDAGSSFAGARDCVSQLTAFLYALDSKPVPGVWVWRERDGVVLLEQRTTQEEMVGDYALTRDPPPFEKIVAGAKLRPSPEPATGLLARADSEPPPRWSSQEWTHVAMALGEVCARDPSMRSELVRRAAAHPANLALTVALGWSGGEDGVALLRRRAAERQPSAYPGDDGSRALVPEAIFDALRHADSTALLTIISPRGAPASVADLRAAGFETALPLLAKEMALADDVPKRRVAVARLRAFLVDEEGSTRIRWVRPLDAKAASSLFLSLANALPNADEALRVDVLTSARWLAFAHRSWEGPEADLGGGGTGGVTITSRAAGVVPYPGAADFLGLLAADLRSGALALEDGSPSLFDRADAPIGNASTTLRSDVGPPAAFTGWGAVRRDGDPALRLRGERTAAGLHLALSNDGDVTVTVDAVALRYATGSVFHQRVTWFEHGETKEVASDAALVLTLGDLPVRASVSEKALRLLKPGESYDWTIPLRAEDAALGHVVVSLSDAFMLRGSAPAPRLGAFATTWVR